MASQKSVKVYVRILDPKTGEVTLSPVGSSHPGEVRLMRIILNLAPAPEAPPSSLQREIPKDFNVKVASTRALRPKSFRVDPTGKMAQEEYPTEEKTCANVAEWFQKIAEERLAGHTLYVADNVRSMLLGFVSDEANTVWYVGISKVKAAKSEDTACMAQFGLSHEEVMGCIRTEKGRNDLIGNNDPIFDRHLLPAQVTSGLESLEVNGVDVEENALDFLSPGSDDAWTAESEPPFWDHVISYLEHVRGKEEGETPNSGKAPIRLEGSEGKDSPRHMTGSAVPSLQYSVIDQALEVALRKDFKVVAPEESEPPEANEVSQQENLKPKEAEFGWCRISYPKDWERVPLVVTVEKEGMSGNRFAKWEKTFEGFFRRTKDGVEIEIENGVRYSANLNSGFYVLKLD